MCVRIFKKSNSVTESLAQTFILIQITQISNKMQSESKTLSYQTCLFVIKNRGRKPSYSC